MNLGWGAEVHHTLCPYARSDIVSFMFFPSYELTISLSCRPFDFVLHVCFSLTTILVFIESMIYSLPHMNAKRARHLDTESSPDINLVCLRTDMQFMS